MADYLVGSVPRFGGNTVTPLLDGAEYAVALRDELGRLDGGLGQFVLVTGWWLGLARGRFELLPGARRARMHDAPGFCLDPWPKPAVPFEDPPDESTALLDLLAAKARAGVDVRVLGWVSPGLLRIPRIARLMGGAHAVAINTLTVRSLRALRAAGIPALASTVGHLAGSTHAKTVLVGDGERTVGFSGGLDLELSRWARPDHTGRQVWHDVVARFDGPATQTLYDFFRTVWEANRTAAPRTVKVDGERFETVPADTPELTEREIPVKAEGDTTVQGLRTFPAAHYRWPARGRPLPGATDGEFGYRDAIRHAIGAASNYVYAEDPLLWSAEVMDWLNEAVRRSPELRVTLVTGGLEDPNDPPLPHQEYLGRALDHLLRGLDAGQRARVAGFRRTGVVVHAKTVIVDDAWACIGSCNLAQRSLYTDIEYGIAFTGEAVRAYKQRLDGHHASKLEPIVMPTEQTRMTRGQKARYEMFNDADSRRRWPRLS